MESPIKQTQQTPRNESLKKQLINQQNQHDLPYRNFRYLVSLVCFLCLSPFYYGYCMTYISTIHPDTLYRYFGPIAGRSDINGYLIGIMPLGAAVGSFFAPFFMKYLSRKNFLLCFNAFAIFILGIIQINNLPLLFVCRFCQGIVVGNYMGVTPVYVKQLTPVALRGTLGAFNQFFNIGAVVVCYSFGLVFQLTNVNEQFFWRFMFAFPAVTVITQSILLLFNFIPQSPASLIQAGQLKQARRILAIFNSASVIDNVFVEYIQLSRRNKFKIRYRRKRRHAHSQQQDKNKQNQQKSHKTIQLQLESSRKFTSPVVFKIQDNEQPSSPDKNKSIINKNILVQPSFFRKESAMTRKPSQWSDYSIQFQNQVKEAGSSKNIDKNQQRVKISIKAFIIGFQLPMMQPFSGVKVIVTQIGAIMGQFSKSLATYTPLFINLVQFIATGASILVLTHLGRRTILLFGNFGTATCSFIVGCFFLSVYITGNNQLVIGAVTFIILFMIIYGTTIGPAVWLYVPEIIPPKIVPPATSMNWLGVAFSVMVTPIIIKAVGSPYPVFFLFAGVSFVFFVVNYLLVIQTKGLQPSQITQKLA